MIRTVFEELLGIPSAYDPRSTAHFDSNGRSHGDREYTATVATPSQFDWSQLDEEICAAKPIEFFYEWDREFSEVLDANRVLWRYKARTFAVEWDQDGNFVDSFTPDFYLPQHASYVELAPWGYGDFGMNVRKVRLLRELYPRVRIEIISSRYYESAVDWSSEQRLRSHRRTLNRREGRAR